MNDRGQKALARQAAANEYQRPDLATALRLSRRASKGAIIASVVCAVTPFFVLLAPLPTALGVTTACGAIAGALVVVRSRSITLENYLAELSRSRADGGVHSKPHGNERVYSAIRPPSSRRSKRLAAVR